MDIDLYLAFVGISIRLIVMPGPNVLLIVSHSISNGRGRGLLVLAGTSAAMALQLMISVMGMTSIMVVLSEWFEWIRWCGAAYLIFLGVRQFLLASQETPVVSEHKSGAIRAVLEGFLVSLTNPKTLLFFGAFLPQFVNPAMPPLQQLTTLAITFFCLATVLDAAYAMLAGRFRGAFLTPERARLRNRISGSLFVGAGVGLALARRN